MFFDLIEGNFLKNTRYESLPKKSLFPFQGILFPGKKKDPFKGLNFDLRTYFNDKATTVSTWKV